MFDFWKNFKKNHYLGYSGFKYRVRKIKAKIKSYLEGIEERTPKLIKHAYASRHRPAILSLLGLMLFSVAFNIFFLVPASVDQTLTLEDFPEAVLGGPYLGRFVKVKVPVQGVDKWRANPGSDYLVFINCDSVGYAKEPDFQLVSLWRSNKWYEYLRERLVGKLVTVRGQLTTYKGQAQLQLKSPQQIIKTESMPTEEVKSESALVEKLGELSKESE